MSSKRVAFLAKTSDNLSTTIRNDKYDNINLNHYHKSEDIKLLKSKVSHFSKTTQNGYAYNDDVVSTKTHIPKSHSSWKTQEMKNVYKWKNKNNGDCNKSTLSLHITSYENEVKNDAFVGKTLKNIPSSAKSQILLYFPRQQNEELMNPEIMRFKASQKLLNFNAIGRNDFFKMASKKLLQLRQLFCHASYLKPSSSYLTAEAELKGKVERQDGMLKTAPSFYRPIQPCSSIFVTTNLIQCRQFSSASDNNMPEMYHLEHVQKRLEHTIPFMFQQRLDFTFYHRDVFYDNQILNMQDHGLDSYMKHLGRISVAGQLAMPYIKMAPLSINLVREDGSVRLRWRVAYLSWLDSLNFKNFKAEYREKNAQWYDGNATFYVGADGLVYKVIIQKLTPDDSFTQKSTKKLAEKIGILPQNTANFVAANSKEKETKDV